MKRRRRVAMLLCATAVCFATADAGAQTMAECTKVLAAFAPGVPVGADSCLTLAVMVATTSPAVNAAAEAILKAGAVPIGAVFSQRDLQARHPQQAATGGTPAQGQAVPGVQPAGVAAGTIAAVGSNSGNDAIAALSINPAILFLGEEVSRQLAQYSRFLDLTMFVPVSGITRDDTTPETANGKVKYYGARLRLNVHGISAGRTVWDRARQLLLNWISRAGRNAERIRLVLGQAPDLNACVTSLMAASPVPAAIAGNCGSPVTLDVDLAEAEELRGELENVRLAADSKYFGADIRVDIGDPTMGAVKNAAGNFLFAGLSGGRRLGGSANGGGNYGLRGRLGVRHAQLDSSDETDFAVEGGVGFELARLIESQEINASVAIEFRQGNGPADLTDRFQTDFVMVRGSVLLPVTSGNSFSINFGAPISGDVSPILSVNFNWGLLLSNALQR
jgi:hypothetical protein